VPGGFNLASASDPVGGVRFATQDHGFLFGSSFWATANQGRSWYEKPDPGIITDLEVGVDGRIWALVRPCANCRSEHLYTATVLQPDLRRVRELPAFDGTQTSLSVDFDGQGIFVLSSSDTGRSERYWSSNGGRVWHQAAGPCNSLGLVTAILRTSSTVLCAAHVRGRDVSRDIYRYHHQGGTERLFAPGLAAPVAANASSFSAEQNGNEIIANSWHSRPRGHASRPAAFEVSNDDGHSWTIGGPRLRNGTSFVGFISQSHVVALPAGTHNHVFLFSYDAGKTWDETSFH